MHGHVTSGVGNGRREHSVAITHHRDNVWLIDRAAHANEITECLANLLGVATQPLNNLWCFKATGVRDPLRQREVVQGHHGHESAGNAGLEDASVVVQRGTRELAFGRLDTGPLNGEAIAVETKGGHDVEVPLVEVKRVASITTGLFHPARFVFEAPPVRVGVITFNLVCRRSGPPEESLWECQCCGHLFTIDR